MLFTKRPLLRGVTSIVLMTVAGMAMGATAAAPPALSDATLAYLRTGFGDAPTPGLSLTRTQARRLAQWRAPLQAVGFRAPERSYLRALFSTPRITYLTRLLDRPALLAELPRYRRLQSAFHAPAPVDTGLEAGLRVLARMGAVSQTTHQLVQTLAAQGYRFAFTDLDVLDAAARWAAARRALNHPAALAGRIREQLAPRTHVARQGSNLPEGIPGLQVLSRVDKLRILWLLRSLSKSSTRGRIGKHIRAARQAGTELGGVVTRRYARLRWRWLASAINRPDRYKRPRIPRFPVEVAGFHLHATPGDDRAAAGPSLMDIMTAAYYHRVGVVITDLGQGRFDVDYYRDVHRLPRGKRLVGRLKAIDLDLGVYAVSGGGTPAAAISINGDTSRSPSRGNRRGH